MRHVRWTRLVAAAAVGSALGSLGVVPSSVGAQEVPAAETVLLARGPRFLLAKHGAEPQPIDVERTPVLRERISLDLDAVSLDEALAKIAREAGIRLVYSGAALDLAKPVSFRSDRVSVAAALTEVLLDAKVDVLFAPSGREAVLVKRGAAPVQVGVIAGRVTEAATGDAIPAVDVRVIGAQITASTDEDGRYVLRDVPVGEQRVAVRRIGYEAQTVTVLVTESQTTEFDFALKPMATRLNELVTTVTGEQRRLEVGNSISAINADSLLQSAPISTFGDLMQGRAAGVLSIQEGGYAGQSGRIRIRGLNSLSMANDPIVVVDGLRVEAGSGTGMAMVTNLRNPGLSPMGGLTGRLADLDPDEIASVEVVRGPSAATLYGTDAANGVLVITTKRGQAGRTRWSVFTEQGRVEEGLDLRAAFPEAYYAFGRSTADGTPQRCTLLQRADGSCVADSLKSFNVMTDPATRPLKDGWREQYGLQVSGGAASGATYFLSGNYEQETGSAFMPAIDQALIRTTQARVVPDWQVRPNAAERLNLRANVTMPLGNRGSATLSTGFISNQARQPRTGLPGTQVGYRNANDGWEDFGGIINLRPAYAFPFRSEDVVRHFMASVVTTYTAAEWLTLRGTVGTDISANAYGELQRRGEGPFVGALAGLNTGFRTANELNVSRYTLEVGATAAHAISPALTSKTSIGLQYNRRAQRGARIAASDLPLGGETTAGGTVNPFGTGEVTLTTAVAGGYLDQVLGFKDRLFLTGALRLDGGSAFGRDFEVAAYPKAHISWVVADGQAGPRLPGVSTLRLRAAYGASGVQPGPTDALALVAVQPGLNVGGTATAPGGVWNAGNPNLRPERSSEIDAGLDLELSQGRVRMEFTAYQRTTDDALVRRQNAASVGGERIENLGSIRNRGLEALLSADLLRGRGIAAGFTATGSLNDNSLRTLGEGVFLGSPADELIKQEVGFPVYGLWGFTIENFADGNGNGIIEPGEVEISGPNSSFLGSTIPRREATLAPYVKLFGERLSLNGLLQYRGGFHRYNFAAWGPCFAGACRAVNDPDTPLADQARAVAMTVFGRLGPAAEEGSYILLRELSLGINLPAALSRAVGALEGRVMVSGRNLALLWKNSALPIESAEMSQDAEAVGTGNTPGPAPYWLLRVHLTY